MNEEFLHFIYRFKLWANNNCYLTTGQKFEIIDTGIYNRDSGPDFFNAKIKIGDTVFVGNVEIHINASDWYNHGHEKDKAYNNVILHVVFNDNRKVYINKRELPTWEIKFSHLLFNKYAEFKLNESDIPCYEYISLVDDFKSKMWFDKMAIERLEDKVSFYDDILKKSSGDFEQIVYLSLAKSFGFGINSDAFYNLAYTTPLNIVKHYTGNKNLLEALFFGQSGLLEDAITDNYVIDLKKSYDFLVRKFNIFPINSSNWKHSRIRPSGNPYMRIAQFVSVMSEFGRFVHLISKNEIDFKEIKNFFNVVVSDYWKNHYIPGKVSENVKYKLGNEAVNSVIINAVIPMLFLWQKYYNPNYDPETILDFLKSLKPENNRITREWERLDVVAKNSYESQAIINLKKNYCDNKRCLRCNIGYEILSKIHKIDFNG
jgi:hypothetical protein